MRKEWEQQQDKWQEESQERLVKRVEEIVIRYIYKRKIYGNGTMGRRKKIVKNDKLREERNRIRDKAIMERMNRMEKRIDRKQKD